jgi:hypothetical protein
MDTYCALQIIIEVPIRELQQYAGLANAGVTNQQYFKHMIQVVIHFQNSAVNPGYVS